MGGQQSTKAISTISLTLQTLIKTPTPSRPTNKSSATSKMHSGTVPQMDSLPKINSTKPSPYSKPLTLNVCVIPLWQTDCLFYSIK